MKDDGGPAFPSGPLQFKTTGSTANPTVETVNFLGMTLRDYFAAKVISAMLDGNLAVVAKEAAKEGLTHGAYLARAAYILADAMLAERAK